MSVCLDDKQGMTASYDEILRKKYLQEIQAIICSNKKELNLSVGDFSPQISFYSKIDL